MKRLRILRLRSPRADLVPRGFGSGDSAPREVIERMALGAEAGW